VTESNRFRSIFAVIGLFAGAASIAPAAAGDSAHGETVFKRCAVCHTDRPGALGPSLKGVYGRKAGGLDDFRYSDAMKQAGFVWDEANLKAYIANPQAKVKGNRMLFAGLQNPGDVEDVVAYLQSLR
jgi:cytochrome c